MNGTSSLFSQPSQPVKRLLRHPPSFFLGYADSPRVHHRPEELVEAYERVKRLKQRFHVVSPSLSLEEMQRFGGKEEQRHPCLGGYRFFLSRLEAAALALPFLGIAHVLGVRLRPDQAGA